MQKGRNVLLQVKGFRSKLCKYKHRYEEMKLTEHSRISYLETLRQKEIDLGRNLDYPTDSSGDEQSDDEVSSKDESNTIKNTLK